MKKMKNIFKVFNRVLYGKSEKIVEEMKNTEAYWDAILKENKNKLENCKHNRKTALGKVDTVKEEISDINKKIIDMEALIKEVKGMTGFSKDEMLKNKTYNAFIRIKKLKAELEVKEEILTQLVKHYEETDKIYRIIANKCNESEIKIIKNKSRIKYSNTIDEMGETLSDIELIDVGDVQSINEKYHTAKATVNDAINDDLTIDIDYDREYKEYMKGL